MKIKCRLFLLIGGAIFAFSQSSFAQEHKLSGSVKDDKGKPLAGVVILDKDSVEVGKTDKLGNFTIANNLAANSNLIFKMSGMENESLNLNPTDSILKIVMSSVQKDNNLQEVIVVGYGSSSKKDLTGAIATVGAKQISQMATSDPMQAIQGRVAGVQIVSNSGEPGSGVQVKIRGTGSVGGSNPIYVVDGYQTTDISYLAPADIQSMNVLKDASAAAIYGARGANGVIVITTKSGKKGPIKVTFDSYTGTQSAWRKIPMTNSQQYATLVEEGYTNDGLSVPSNISGKLDSAKNGLLGTGTDWQDEVLRTGLIQNYTIGLSGGNEVNTFRLSGTYFDQNGIVKNSMMKKYFFNLSDQFKVNNWLRGGFNASFAHYDKTNYNGDLYGGVLTNALSAEPLAPVKTADGNWGRPGISYANNPARVANEIKGNHTYGTMLIGNIWLEATLAKGLKFKSQFNAGTNNLHTVTYLPEFYIDVVEQRSQSSLYDLKAEENNWLWTNYFTYNKNVGRHSFDFMAGAEWQDFTHTQTDIMAYDVPSDENLRDIYNAQNTSYTVNPNNTALPDYSRGLQSFFGRFSYNYAGRYMFTATLRDDASSKFLKGNRSGMFPAFSGAWVISDESFFHANSLFSYLKMRAGWGIVGNEQSPNAYPYISSIGNNNLYVFGNSVVQGYAPTTFGNTELKWEKNKQYNLGIDLNMFSDRLTFSADAFLRRTVDLILPVPVPLYSGAPASPSMNTGTMENKGIEISLGYSGGHKFKYNISGNATFLSNKLTSLGLGDVMSLGSTGKLGYINRAEPNMPFPYIFGLKTDGVFHTQQEVNSYVNSAGTLIQPNAKPGDVKFVDTNGDGSITNDDAVNLGNAIPKIQFGLNAQFNYQNFDLSLFFQGVTGNKIINAMDYNIMSVSNESGGWNNFRTDRMDRWTAENPNSNEPRMTVTDANGNMKFSDRYVENGSYLRLKVVQFGYNFPENTLSKWKLSSLRIYLAADNLFTLTGYKGFDPEVNGYYQDPGYTGIDVGGYPQARALRVGINLGL
ncbi:SusC/RagA family TonB-linked outer membrane protein [Rhizosphaericola mali]|nr:TonB-dependent receptor [Rhizosphaericola mali]